jgi:putative transposase
LTTKLQVDCDDRGRALLLHLSEGQATIAAAVLEDLPPASHLLADRAYGSSGFREALVAKGITPLHPASCQRPYPVQL